PVRTLVFLPRAQIASAEFDQLPRARFLESRSHPRDVAFGRNDGHERALAQAPADAGEVEHARTALEQDRVDAVVGHEPPRFFDACQPLAVADGDDARGHRPEAANGGRHVAGGRRSALTTRTVGGALYADGRE